MPLTETASTSSSCLVASSRIFARPYAGPPLSGETAAYPDPGLVLPEPPLAAASCLRKAPSSMQVPRRRFPHDRAEHDSAVVIRKLSDRNRVDPGMDSAATCAKIWHCASISAGPSTLIASVWPSISSHGRRKTAQRKDILQIRRIGAEIGGMPPASTAVIWFCRFSRRVQLAAVSDCGLRAAGGAYPL